MSRYVAGARAAGAGSTTLPSGSLYAVTGGGCRIREIGVFNTTTTAVSVAVRRLSTAGTQGSAITVRDYDSGMRAATMTPFNTHTGGPTITAGFMRVATLGAAAGAGVVWTFGDSGLVIPAGTTNGIGIVTATGTGQVVDFYFDWDE